MPLTEDQLCHSSSSEEERFEAQQLILTLANNTSATANTNANVTASPISDDALAMSGLKLITMFVKSFSSQPEFITSQALC